MRSTIGLKIFSIALVLLALMIVVAAISTHSVRGVDREVLALARYYVPVTHALSRIDLHALREVLHLERLRLLYRTDRGNRRAIEAEEAAFKEAAAAVGREIEAARSLAGAALANTRSAVDRVEMARTESALAAIVRERRAFDAVAARMRSLLEQGEEAQAALLLTALGDEKGDVDEEVDGLRKELQGFTRKSAGRVADHVERVMLLSWIVTLLAIALGLVFALNVTRGLVNPVLALLKGTKEVERGNLDADVPVKTSDEIGMLTQAFNHMLTELRAKERIKDTFGKYVDPRIVESLIADPAFVAGGGRREVMTIAFCDIAGFTGIGEGMTPGGLVNLLNRYFDLMSRPVREHKGIIDKYIGDAIMAFWGPPFTAARQHAALACCAALDQLERLEEFRREMPELLGIRKGLPRIDVRIGISTGDVVVGNIGSEFSRGYTVIGDTANLGSRLEGANKHYGTRVLICETTRSLAGDAIETREVDSIRVAGKSEPVRIFELLARRGGLDAAARQARDRFEAGLDAYRRGRFDEARDGFHASLATAPSDAPARLFLSRLERFAQTPPPADWDGVWTFDSK